MFFLSKKSYEESFQNQISIMKVQIKLSFTKGKKIVLGNNSEQHIIQHFKGDVKLFKKERNHLNYYYY